MLLIIKRKLKYIMVFFEWRISILSKSFASIKMHAYIYIYIYIYLTIINLKNNKKIE